MPTIDLSGIYPGQIENKNMQKRVIAIVGPKGGVGKSTISANLAISIASMGIRVTAVDLDLGGANLHVILGIRDVANSLDDFLLKKVKTLEEVVIETGIKNLRLICGGGKIPDIANLPFQQKIKLTNHLAKLEGDVVILDLAAGSSFNVVDFLFIAHMGLVITTPEVTSLMKVYSFIKSSIFRLLTFHFKSKHSDELTGLLERAKDVDANPTLKTIENLLSEAQKIDTGAVESARQMLKRFIPHIVINMARSQADSNSGRVVQNLMKQYLSIESTVLATLPEDEAVKRAIFQLKPVMVVNPDCVFSRAVKDLAVKCLRT
ncbi:MAG: AAA family ATPase [Nitrospirae bacterium]|nr:AAA family ATPase [Nitrospirota bacterium]